MEYSADYDFAGDYVLDFRTPGRETDSDSDSSTSRSPSPERSDQVDEPSSEPSDGQDGQKPAGLPLLRRSDLEDGKVYSKNNPTCIHYDFIWKLSLRENIRARPICGSSQPEDVIIAPSDFWMDQFQTRLERAVKDKEKFPGDVYSCDKTTITISVEKTRGRGLKEEYSAGQDIDWHAVDKHMEGLGTLCKVGRKITLSVEFVYKEVAHESTGTKAAKRAKKKKTQTDVQRARLAAEAGLWTRVYKHHRCRGKYCKKGPHCWRDRLGNHHKLDYKVLKALHQHIMQNMKEGETLEDVDVTVEIPASILKDVLHNDRAGSVDPTQTLKDYCTGILAEVQSDRTRKELEHAVKFAMDQCLELQSVTEHSQVVISAMVRVGVKLGSALHFVSSIKRFMKERSSIQQKS